MNAIILFVATVVVTTVMPLPQKIRIGGLFDAHDESMVIAFQSAVASINRNKTLLPNTKLEALVERIAPHHPHDSFEASIRVCSLMSSGVAAIFGPQSSSSAFHVQSICDAYEIPHIDTRSPAGLTQNVGALNFYPDPTILGKAYKDLVQHWKWKEFAVIYDDSEVKRLVRLKDLFSNKPRTEFPIIVRQLPPGDDYRDVLRQIKKLKYTNIIVDCTTDKVFTVLKQAQQIGIMTENHHYLLTSLDVDTVDTEDFRYSGTKITSLRVVNPNNIKVIKAVNHMDSLNPYGMSPTFSLKTETALMFDAVEVFARALPLLDAVQKFTAQKLSCDSEVTREQGYSLFNYMKSVKLERGLSGEVQLNTNGFRTVFDVEIMNINESGLQRIGYWSSHYNDKKVIGLHIDEDIYIEKQPSGQHLKIAIITKPPYAMTKETSDLQTGNDQYEGYCIDLIEQIAEIVKFNYTFFKMDTAGREDETTGEWSGAIGEVKKGNMDIGIGDISITEKRESVVDFTTPFMNLGISILFQKPKPAAPSLLSFLAPFSNSVWVYMCVTYVGVSLILFVLARLSPTEWDNPYPCIQEPDVLQNDFGILNSMWFTIGSLMQQGSDIAPKAASTRLVSGMWWLFTLIMISSYTANLAASLTIDTFDIPFKNVQELAQQTKIKYGCYKAGTTEDFFKYSPDKVYQQMWSFMASQSPSVFMGNNEDGANRVLAGGYAYFMESNSIEYSTERDCNLTKVGGQLDNKGYGIMVNKNLSQLRNKITAAILYLQEHNKIQILQTKWWKQKRGGGKCKDNMPSSIKALGLANVGGIFVVLVAGMTLAAIAASAEFIVKTRSVASHERDTVWQEMIKEFKFAMSCKNSKKVPKKIPSEHGSGLADALPLSSSKYTVYDREIFS